VAFGGFAVVVGLELSIAPAVPTDFVRNIFYHNGQARSHKGIWKQRRSYQRRTNGLSDGNDRGCNDGEANGIPNALNNDAIKGFHNNIVDVALRGTPEGKALGLPKGDADF
jgi:hypothetical protein